MPVKLLSKSITSAVLTAALALMPSIQASAFELTQGTWLPEVVSPNWAGSAADTTATTSLPSGLQASVAVTGAVKLATVTTDSFYNRTSLDMHGGAASDYVSGTTVNTPGVVISNYCNNCAMNSLVSNRGNLTISFSHPVTNPVVNLSGVGGWSRVDTDPGAGTSYNYMNLWTEFELTSPNASLALLTSNNRLVIDNSGKKILPNPAVQQGALDADCSWSGWKAGCGSVQIIGTGSTFTFRMDYNSRWGVTGNPMGDDTFIVTVAVQDDYGSAPTTYDTATTTNVVGDLFLGSGVTADALQTLNASSADGDDELTSSFKAFPSGLPNPDVPGSAYSLTFPVTSGAAGQVCGWVDWNANGFFDSNEEVCAALSAGTANVTLTWTIPQGAATSTSWARLRAAYQTSGQLPAAGPLDSGETEDFTIAAVPRGPVASPASVSLLQNATATFAAITGTGGLATAGSSALAPSSTCLVDPTTSVCGTSVTTTYGTYTLVPSSGIVTFVNNGTIPSSASSISYRVTDSAGRTALSTLSPAITPITPPSATSATINVLPNGSGAFPTITDPGGLASAGSSPLVSASTCIVDPTTSACGTSVVTNYGTYTLVPASGIVTFVNNGTIPSGSVHVTYRVTTSSGETATSTLSPRIAAPTPATPVAVVQGPSANAATLSVLQGGTVSFKSLTGLEGLASQGTYPLNPASTCLVDVTKGTCGTSVSDEAGTYSLALSTGIVTFVSNGTNPTTSSSINYRVTDTLGLSAISTLTIKVTPFTPRLLSATPDRRTGTLNRTVTLMPAANDPNSKTVLLANSVVICASVCPNTTLPGKAGGPLKTAQGIWSTNSETGEVHFAPEINWFGTASIHYTVFDATGNRAQSTITVTIAKPKLPARLVYSGDSPVTTMKQGTPIATIKAPRLGKNWSQKIFQGTSLEKVLNTLGLGHYEMTQLPGTPGNFAVAGHRFGSGGPFLNIDKFVKGDKVFVTTKDGQYTYQYLQTKVVAPTAVGVLLPNPEGLTVSHESKQILTLQTCTPVHINTKRLIVWFQLIDFSNDSRSVTN